MTEKKVRIANGAVTLRGDRTWDFSKKPTYLQTDSGEKDKAFWYLTHDKGDDPEYHYELNGTRKDVIGALVHLSDKPWVNKAQLFEAMLPALRAVAYK